MLEIIRDEQNNIKACLEWWLVNSDGSFNDKGEFVWVNELEIAPQYRNNGIVKSFIKTIMNKVPTAKAGYFQRRKYSDRIKLFTRRQWEKRIKEE